MKLSIRDLEVAHGRTAVLFGVTLEVPEGQLTCLMGRNGSGKSTLLNAVCGLLPIRAGSVHLGDEDITHAPAWYRTDARIGYVPQGHRVFPHLSTLENLQVVVERKRPKEAGAIDEALDIFPRLKPLLGRPAGLLSGGQAKQLAIARALVLRPKLLVLDEPTEGIQPSIILEIEDAISSLHQATGMSILLVEQYVEFALRLAQRYSIMDHGVIAAEGDTADADPSQFSELLAV